jgi:hypothetical protein
MLKSVNEKTWVVEVSREASTVEAIRAALVDKDEGKGGARTVSWTGAGVEVEDRLESFGEAMTDLDFEGT